MSIKKNAAILMLTRILTMGFALASSIFLTRILGPEWKGVFTKVGASVELLGLIVSFHISTSIIYFSASKKLSIGKVQGLSVFSLLIQITLILLTVGILYLSGNINLLLPEQYLGWILLAYFGARILVSRVQEIMGSFMRGATRFEDLFISNVLTAFLRLITWAALFVYAKYAITTYSLGSLFLVDSVLMLIGLLLVLYFFLKFFGIRPNFQLEWKQDVKPFFAYTMVGFMVIITNFLNKKIDIWFVEDMAGMKALGYYGLAASLGEVLLTFSSTFRSVLIPYLSRDFENNRAESIRNLKLFSRINVSFISLAAVIAILISPWIIPILYGAEFSESVLPFQILVVAICFLAFRSVFSAFNIASNKLQYNLIANLTGFLITIGLDLWLIPLHGIVGAAIASLAAYFVSSIIIIYTVIVLQKLPWDNYFFLTPRDARIAISLVRQKINAQLPK
ncbi:MAG: oligosaccharide flippase family protein [Bacteroidota bacterium]